MCSGSIKLSKQHFWKKCSGDNPLLLRMKLSEKMSYKLSAKSILHTPQEARLNVWPYTLDYSVWIWYNLPDVSIRLASLEKLTNASFPVNSHVHRTRVFGRPVFVLHPTLQDAKKLPKWQNQSWKGMLLGFSPQHSTNVYLGLNLETGSIAPPFHVIFDEHFSTIMIDMNADYNDTIRVWDILLGIGYAMFGRI
jgi:hypothetical protein